MVSTDFLTAHYRLSGVSPADVFIGVVDVSALTELNYERASRISSLAAQLLLMREGNGVGEDETQAQIAAWLRGNKSERTYFANSNSGLTLSGAAGYAVLALDKPDRVAVTEMAVRLVDPNPLLRRHKAVAASLLWKILDDVQREREDLGDEPINVMSLAPHQLGTVAVEAWGLHPDPEGQGFTGKANEVRDRLATYLGERGLGLEEINNNP